MKFYRIVFLVFLIAALYSVVFYNLYSLKYHGAYDETSQNIKIVLYLVFIVILSYIYAMIEIEIEGEHGWAQSLPTWIYDPKWLKKILSGKYITGYHFFLIFLFIPAIFHIPIFFSEWNIFKECIALGSYFFFIVCEDFLWFVFNPHFGLKNFNSRNKKIWWHSKWFGPVPDLYLEGILISAILFTLGMPHL